MFANLSSLEEKKDKNALSGYMYLLLFLSTLLSFILAPNIVIFYGQDRASIVEGVKC